MIGSFSYKHLGAQSFPAATLLIAPPAGASPYFLLREVDIEVVYCVLISKYERLTLHKVTSFINIKRVQSKA